MQKFFKGMLGHFLPGEDNAYRPHLLRKPWLLFFLTIVLTVEGVYVASLLVGQSAQNFLSAVLPGEVIALTNTERTQAGDATVTENMLLDSAAQAKANDMAAQGYFAHVGPGDKQPWAWISEAGYAYQYAGENLAVRFDESSDVVRAWMASPTHRANIIKPVYSEIGIGVAQGTYEGAPATFVVQYFGTPQSQLARAEASVPAQVRSTPPTVPAADVAGAETQKPAAAAPSSTPAVEGALPAPVQTRAEQPMREAAQVFLKANEASGATVSWILGGILTLLVLLLSLAFFVHIEIQPGDMLAGGAFVAVVAASLFMLNGSLGVAEGNPTQSASISFAVPAGAGVLVGPGGAETMLGDSTVAPVPGQ